MQIGHGFGNAYVLVSLVMYRSPEHSDLGGMGIALCLMVVLAVAAGVVWLLKRSRLIAQREYLERGRKQDEALQRNTDRMLQLLKSIETDLPNRNA